MNFGCLSAFHRDSTGTFLYVQFYGIFSFKLFYSCTLGVVGLIALLDKELAGFYKFMIYD